MSLINLDDEKKLQQAIEYVAVGHPLPDVYVEFLKEAGLYESIVEPKGVKNAGKIRSS